MLQGMTLRVDVHQHIWTDPLLERLAERETLPLIRHSDGLTVLHSAAEQAYVIDVTAEAAERRATLVRRDGLNMAVIAISSPVGIEALPAGSLIDPEGLYRVGSILERAAERRAPLFVHPGHGLGAAAIEAPFGEPLWWRALTDYVAQMQAAWLTFASFGRREHPDLEVVFAMLAGCAPLHRERLETRGGPAIELHDPGIFYEISSYGPAAVDTMARLVGLDQLLYGSDRPVIEPAATGREALLQANGARILQRVRIEEAA
jgi:hypothetical protein